MMMQVFFIVRAPGLDPDLSLCRPHGLWHRLSLLS